MYGSVKLQYCITPKTIRYTTRVDKGSRYDTLDLFLH